MQPRLMLSIYAVLTLIASLWVVAAQARSLDEIMKAGEIKVGVNAVALWIAAILLGIALAASTDRQADGVPIAIILVLLVALAATADHLIAIRETRR